MTKSLKLGLIFIFLVQVLISMGFELSHDEAYYWLYSKNLDWGYFDHPPMVGLIIRLFSFLPHSELSVRVGFILLQLFTLITLFKLTPVKTHHRVVWLFFAFPLASFSGILALPDMPLLFLTALYCLALHFYLKDPNPKSVLGLSLVIPILLYAKYHGILLVFFTIVALPKLLKQKEFYLIALLSLVLFSPHLYWQYQHEFSTLRYHFLERPKALFSFFRSLEYVGIQIALAGLFAGPLVWWISAKFKSEDDFTRVMKAIALGLFAFFLLSTFSKKVEANWTISATIPLIFLCVSSELWNRKWASILLLTSFSIVFLARILLVLPADKFPIKRLHEFHGWSEWAKLIQEKCGPQEILANNYQIASKLSFYLQKDVHALNYHSRKNQFDIWRFDRFYQGQSVCYLTDKSQFKGEKILTPEGKKIRIATRYTLAELQNLKNQD